MPAGEASGLMFWNFFSLVRLRTSQSRHGEWKILGVTLKPDGRFWPPLTSQCCWSHLTCEINWGVSRNSVQNSSQCYRGDGNEKDIFMIYVREIWFFRALSFIYLIFERNKSNPNLYVQCCSSNFQWSTFWWWRREVTVLNDCGTLGIWIQEKNLFGQNALAVLTIRKLRY